jgi:MFS superfamily sulfate permease-like transporter
MERKSRNAASSSEWSKSNRLIWLDPILIFLTPLFRNMPQPALAAIVIAAMLPLKPSYSRELVRAKSLVVC